MGPVMDFPPVTLSDWRARVEKELAGRPFDKVLVQETMEGVAIAPLYTEAPAGEPLGRDVRARPFRICMRQAPGASVDALTADFEGGADAAWLRHDESLDGVFARHDPASTFFVFDTDDVSPVDTVERVAEHLRPASKPSFALNCDPLARCARNRAAFATLPDALTTLGHIARFLEDRFPSATAAMVSTLAYHDAGAGAADELAIALATGVRYLEALRESGLSPDQAARQIAVQISVGRDTFLELCKVRALRTCWQKLLAAAGAGGAPRTLVHAVCSSRTLTVRDPWVNMLRVTTQVFSAVLGGADLVTPSAFDQALGTPSALGQRVARNTGLVLREESFLGKVTDPAGGSYYLETLTDALAREAWKRFQAIEHEGGITAALESGRLLAKLEAAWHERLARVANRKTPILGVSEFANLDEKLPQSAASANANAHDSASNDASLPNGAPPNNDGALPIHRDAEAFEALRTRAEAAENPPEALLVTLGPLAESRPRAGFAAGFFTAGGIRTREGTEDERVAIACLCGSDERYAAEATARARSLKAAGCERVLVAGRPGALEAALRDAGVDGFIFVGCDAVATLSDLLGDPS